MVLARPRLLLCPGAAYNSRPFGRLPFLALTNFSFSAHPSVLANPHGGAVRDSDRRACERDRLSDLAGSRLPAPGNRAVSADAGAALRSLSGHRRGARHV